MKKYIALYNAPAEAMAKMADMSPEQKAAGMKPWQEWMGKHGDKLTDPGAPCSPGNRITPKNEWSNSNNQVTGYSLVSADSLEEAKKMFKDHPHLSWHPGASIDISECMTM